MERGQDIRTIEELPGHSDGKTTMIYTHVLNHGLHGITSPADSLQHNEHYDERTRLEAVCKEM